MTAKTDPVNPLDAALVLGVLAIIGGTFWALGFHEIPKENLPILAGALGTLMGTILGAYAAYRWSASQHAKTQTPGTVTATMTATAETEKPE